MQSKIERQVMASVGVVYTARLLVSRIAVELYALAAAGIALWQFTWVHHVLANWAQVGAAHTVQYLSYAFVHTQLATQLAVVVAAIAASAFIVDAIRTLLRPHPSLLLPLRPLR